MTITFDRLVDKDTIVREEYIDVDRIQASSRGLSIWKGSAMFYLSYSSGVDNVRIKEDK